MSARFTGHPLSEEDIDQILPLLLAAGQITPDEREAVRRDAEVGLPGTRYAAMIADARRAHREAVARSFTEAAYGQAVPAGSTVKAWETALTERVQVLRMEEGDVLVVRLPSPRGTIGGDRSPVNSDSIGRWFTRLKKTMGWDRAACAVIPHDLELYVLRGPSSDEKDDAEWHRLSRQEEAHGTA